MGALPHFRLDTVPVEEDRIEMMEKLEQTAPCYIRDCGPESIVLAVENVGKDEDVYKRQVLGEPMLAKLERIRKKYGILEP